MDVNTILMLVLQILANLPVEEQLIKNAIDALSSDDQAKLKAMLPTIQAASDAQHAAAQGM